MSQQVDVTVNCPNCGNSYSSKLFRTVWGGSMRVSVRVSWMMINILECPHCHHSFHAPMAICNDLTFRLNHRLNAQHYVESVIGINPNKRRNHAPWKTRMVECHLLMFAWHPYIFHLSQSIFLFMRRNFGLIRCILIRICFCQKFIVNLWLK